MSNIINLVTAWFKPQPTTPTTISEQNIRTAVTQLNAMTDRELDELGLTRGSIEYAVRYGRPQDQWDKAA